MEASREASNQHEFNGSAELLRLLGKERIERRATRFLRLSDDAEPVSAEAKLTWYDARERHPTRSEWRLYFTSNDAMDEARAGDLLVLALRPDGGIIALLAPEDSATGDRLAWLFGLQGKFGAQFRFIEVAGANDRTLDFVASRVLEALGFDALPSETERLDALTASFGDEFPSTQALSRLARENAGAPDPREDPDGALVGWIGFEEALFRRLERRIVGTRLEAGFLIGNAADVDGFLSFSLSVQNRRKSRMGFSLENHVEAILIARSIRHSRGATTEARSRPDFVFPGADAYRNPAFDPDLLTMLAVKSTLKERWRQVLAEAARIERKHLLTLETGLSEWQADEMTRHKLALVVPSPLQPGFSPGSRRMLTSFREFLDLAAERQRRSGGG